MSLHRWLPLLRGTGRGEWGRWEAGNVSDFEAINLAQPLKVCETFRG